MDETDIVSVIFTPSGRRGDFAVGTPLLEAARQLGVDIDSVCGGRGLCGRCQIVCAEGSFPKHGIQSGSSHLNPVSQTELRYAERKSPLEEGRRLSCHALIQGPVVIDVPPESQVHRQIVRKSAEVRDIELMPDIRLCYVEVPEDSMEEPASDLSRLRLALKQEWNLTDLDCDVAVLPLLHSKLRDGGAGVTVAVYSETERSRLIAVWPGLVETVYGAAIDVGSTTIALHLTDLHQGNVLASVGKMNPQIRFGEDLMSRVSYVMMQPEGAKEMTAVVRTAINELIAEAAGEVGIDPELIVSLAVAANPIMHHLLLGIDPSPLGSAPFTLATEQSVSLPSRELGIDINPGGRLYIPPCIAGHVGADTASVILSDQLYKRDEITLIIDIGTNAEIVLGNRAKLLACSSPTGPAFEGAQISCGQRAAAGAIERVRIDPESLAVRYRVIGSELWSDEAGFADAIAATGVTGICGSGIIEAVAEMYLSGVLTADGVINETQAARTDRIIKDGRTCSFVLTTGESQIVVTQTDVRQIQLAKAALYAGVRLLMDEFPVTRVDRIHIAGAFGSNIDTRHAMVLGLIPDCELTNVSSIGNAASTGVRIALLNTDCRREIEQVVSKVQKIETAVSPGFQQYFVEAMAIPHKTDPFPLLFSSVTKPATHQSPEPGGQRRRNRRNRSD